jgi:hypothetical protein
MAKKERKKERKKEKTHGPTVRLGVLHSGSGFASLILSDLMGAG